MLVALDGDCAIVYEQDYIIDIASYQFRPVRRTIERNGNIKALRQLAIQGYQDSLQRLQDVRTRGLPTEGDQSELHSWRVTRLHPSKLPLFQDIVALRMLMGKGHTIKS